MLDFEEAYGYLLPSPNRLAGGGRQGTRPQIAHCAPPEEHESFAPWQMNHVDQWGSILQPKRHLIAGFAWKESLQAQLSQFISEWNQHAHPFHWSTKWVAKVMPKVPATDA